jgi:hypothetical protein
VDDKLNSGAATPYHSTSVKTAATVGTIPQASNVVVARFMRKTAPSHESIPV